MKKKKKKKKIIIIIIIIIIIKTALTPVFKSPGFLSRMSNVEPPCTA